LWSEHRQVRKTATVQLSGGACSLDPVLTGRTVGLVFDPFDLTCVEVCWNGTPCGPAIPQQIRRHAHPRARPEQPGASPPAATGINYLNIIAAGHQAAQQRLINYDALAAGDGDLT
jgi:putative transposase